MKNEIRILTPTGMLGYGFPIDELERGISMNPDIIAVDSGSTDSGPHKLGLGHMTCSYEAYYKDISEILQRAYPKKIPLYISSAGGDGSNEHVDDFVDIINKICMDNDYKIKMAVIYSNVSKETVINKMEKGKISPCGPIPELTTEEVEKAVCIVGQMGVEPYLKVLEEYDLPDIIISGRSYDPVPMAVAGIKNGFDPGLCWHMGKIMECGAICAEPAGKGIFGIINKDGFILEPLSMEKRCTKVSVAAHSLYEKSHPVYLPGPGGTLDLSSTKFEQVDDRRVKVTGTRFIPSEKYTIKLEGSKVTGYRTIFIAGIKDSILIGKLDEVVEKITSVVKDTFQSVEGDDYRIYPHIYGKNGVMAEYELFDLYPKEVCFILEVAASAQATARKICSKFRTELLHFPYEGRIGTAGNIALPFAPLETDLGPVCEFNVYHLMEVDDPLESVEIKYLEVSHEK